MSSQDTCALRFTRTQRLIRPAQYSRVMAKARRSADRYFTVLARSNDADSPRLGLAIAKKAARRAVDRNRIKRIAREAFRHTAAMHGVRTATTTGNGPQDRPMNLDLVVFARRDAATETDRAALRNSLNRHFTRLLYKDAH